jgi:uncharacterized protein with FMN-binding domain
MSRPTPEPTTRLTRRNAAVFVASVVVFGLLMLYPTSTNSNRAPRRPGQALAPAGIVAPSRGPTTNPTATPSTSPGANAVPATTVVNGTSADTRYGPVQVQLAVQGGRIVRATAIDYPQGSGRDREINSFAIPQLQQETVAAQSAHIDTVSGATYTSDGYQQSLQAALDLVHLG